MLTASIREDVVLKHAVQVVLLHMSIERYATVHPASDVCTMIRANWAAFFSRQMPTTVISEPCLLQGRRIEADGEGAVLCTGHTH